LVEGDENGVSDIFMRDVITGTTTIVSVSSDETFANGDSSNPFISSDGRYVVFESYADNLVTGLQSPAPDIFIRDTVTGTTRLVSVPRGGMQEWSFSYEPSVSADGRYVAFYSPSDLVSSDLNGQWDVFVRDMVTNTTEIVSVSSSEEQGNSFSQAPAISPDGRYVAFQSDASNLVSDDWNGQQDLFLRDLQAGTTILISVDSAGNQANSISGQPSVSANGRYVAFSSWASNLTYGDTNFQPDVFVRDVLAGTTTRVSVHSNGTGGNRASEVPTISADGRYVVFQSSATNLVSGDTNSEPDVFMRDTLLATTTLVSVDSNGIQGNHGSFGATISSDGMAIAFTSWSTNLVAGDSNDSYDVFVHYMSNSPSDTTPPMVQSITRLNANPTLEPQVDFQVTFSENVIGVDVSDFNLTSSGPSGATVNTVSGSGNLYTVSVGTGNGPGTLRLDVVDDDSILDAASNPLGGAGLGNGEFNLGEFYTIPEILTVNLNSVAANDGWILESGENSNVGGSINSTTSTFNVGDEKSNKQSIGILHFDTSGIPDNAIITSITLQVRKQGITGTDPFTTHGGLALDIQTPHFGTTAALQTNDFEATPGVDTVASFDPVPVNNWYSAVVDSTWSLFIDLAGTTQFRLRFGLDDDNDRSADMVKFYSGEAAPVKGSTTTNRPHLVIEYYIP
jgi:Tol biopolymer transport system component